MSEKEEQQVENGLGIFCDVITVIFAIVVGIFGVHKASGFWFCTWIFIECFTTTLIGGFLGSRIGLWMRNYVGDTLITGRSQSDLFWNKLFAQIGLPLGGVFFGGLLVCLLVGKLFHGELFMKW